MSYVIQDPEMAAMQRMMIWHVHFAEKCSHCGCPLGARDSVQVDVCRRADPDDIVACKILCAQCYDKNSALLFASFELYSNGFMVRRTDGRLLFADRADKAWLSDKTLQY